MIWTRALVPGTAKPVSRSIKTPRFAFETGALRRTKNALNGLMYIPLCYYACMVRRTTIELDQDLVARAKKALGAKTTRETVEEALRRAVQGGEGDRARRAAEQRAYLQRLSVHADIKVLNSEEMWR